MNACHNCRFRLMINEREFHCAAWHYNWAYISDLKNEVTMPLTCPRHVEGEALVVGKELEPSEFRNIAGGRIRAEDWRIFKEREAIA